MRGKVAKRLRRAIYGEDYSPSERQYEWVVDNAPRLSKYTGILMSHTSHRLVNRGRSASYQQLKKAVRNGR